MGEFQQKIQRIQSLLDENGLDGLVLQQIGSFAWATCGGSSYVNTATSDGIATLLVTKNGDLHLFTNTIEAPRLKAEEPVVEQGWQFHVVPWYSTENLLGEVTKGMKLGSDSGFFGTKDLRAEMARLRANLLPEEGERYRTIGRICAEAMDSAIRAVRPGMSEWEIDALLDYETEKRGAKSIVNLIATDERIFNFRHPIPSDKKMDRYAMLVSCGRKDGLIASITRLVHFGPLPDEIRHKMQAVAQIDAIFLSSTKPGHTLGEIFHKVQEAYAATGYADEWQLHHQGGPAAYEPREWTALPGMRDVVLAGQAYAWNPSITGAKSEDTILVSETGFEVITEIKGWPMIPVVVDGQTIPRPAILEVD